MIKDFIHFFVLSCKRATLLIEKQLHTDLGVMESLQLKLHLSICGLCKESDSKSKLLHLIMSKRAKAVEDVKCNFKAEDITQFKSDIKQKLMSDK